MTFNIDDKSRLSLHDFNKTSGTNRKLLAIKNCLLQEPNDHNLDLLKQEFKSEVFTPKEMVDQYFMLMDFPKYMQVQLEAENLMYMAMVTREFNKLRAMDNNPPEPFEFSYKHHRSTVIMDEFPGMTMFSFSEGMHVKFFLDKARG